MTINKETSTPDRKEDTEEILWCFLERDLVFVDVRNVKIVHHTGKSKDTKPHPILARFLRLEDVQQIFSLGQT